jgi:hypothetical protein
MLNIILISVLVIIWWTAVWGLIEMSLKAMIGSSIRFHAIAYSLMIVGVLTIAFFNPAMLDTFI